MVDPVKIEGYTVEGAAALWQVGVQEVYRLLRAGRRGKKGIPPEKVVYAGKIAYIDIAYAEAEAARRESLRQEGIKKYGRR